MTRADSVDLKLLGGTLALLRAQRAELPQRDDLCGAFCGALALRAAGIDGRLGEPLDQDSVALAAGTIVSRVPDGSSLPHDERGRRDYRITPPFIEDASVSGTTAGGLTGAIDELSGERSQAIPFGGPWSAETLDGLFELALACRQPVTLIANVATRHLWGGAARPDQLLGYLLEGELDGPPADWDVGHFVCVFGRALGPGGSVYGVADTYPSLGRDGVHLQPRELLATALQRPGSAPGGMIAVVSSQDAAALRSGAGELGLIEGPWDNGTLARETPR
jgi:hypothetical protein